MSEFLSKELVQGESQCKKNLIGIAAYSKRWDNKPYMTAYSETLNGKCSGCTNSCDYVDIFGVMLVKLAVKITDISLCNLAITSIDSETGEYKDPIKYNLAAVRLLLHMGITCIYVKTEVGYIKYNRQNLFDLLK